MLGAARMSTATTGVERTFGEEEIIVSKTDRSGRITYANDVFLRVSGYTEAEILGAPHSVIRHPDMPRAVFALLWERVLAGHEVFAYVVNLAKDGAHYWVLAHVTPTFDAGGGVTGFHSNRRSPTPAAVQAAAGLYREMLAAERREGAKADQIAAGRQVLDGLLAARGVPYDEFVFSL